MICPGRPEDICTGPTESFLETTHSHALGTPANGVRFTAGWFEHPCRRFLHQMNSKKGVIYTKQHLHQGCSDSCFHLKRKHSTFQNFQNEKSFNEFCTPSFPRGQLTNPRNLLARTMACRTTQNEHEFARKLQAGNQESSWYLGTPMFRVSPERGERCLRLLSCLFVSFKRRQQGFFHFSRPTFVSVWRGPSLEHYGEATADH